MDFVWHLALEGTVMLTAAVPTTARSVVVFAATADVCQPKSGSQCKGDTANEEFRNLATVLGYEHKLDASRRGLLGLSSHHRRNRSTSGASGSGQLQQEFVRDEGDDAICDEDEQARRLIAAEESQSPITPVNFQVRTLLRRDMQ
eukprot:11235-Heterococcus_DN1.PRE.2